MTSNRLVLDLETTDLLENPDACIITVGASLLDQKYNLLDRINNGEEVLINDHAYDITGLIQSMNPDARRMHEENGLIDALLDPNIPKFTLAEAEQMILDLMGRFDHLTTDGRVSLVGLGVGEFDRVFLRKFMPTLEAALHYRSHDYSSFAKIVQDLAPGIVDFGGAPFDGRAHTAQKDVDQTIRIINWYRQNLLLVNRSNPVQMKAITNRIISVLRYVVIDGNAVDIFDALTNTSDLESKIADAIST